MCPFRVRFPFLQERSLFVYLCVNCCFFVCVCVYAHPCIYFTTLYSHTPTQGCTSPKVTDADVIIYLGDGRFHLESIMISNPHLPAYRYDPYSKVFSKEGYDTEKMHANRKGQIEKAQNAKRFGIILGTLGRQGSTGVLDYLLQKLKDANKDYVVVLLSEIFPAKLAAMSDVDAWVQIACPRLSIDWGTCFDAPLLTPYELSVVLKEIKWQNEYPMDFYASKASLGPWTPNNIKHKPPRKRVTRTKKTKKRVEVDEK
eukprot:m.56021 g.56021  ORF g.56021 m.56021 type:complete len:257 (+) comp11165_c0_seq2:610-1380(+)